MTRPALRIDDLGASSKLYERHRHKWRAYREMTTDDLFNLDLWLTARNSKCTLAVTACWVDGPGILIPYGKKFPEETRILRHMAMRRVEIACHGLTHCIPGKHLPTRWPWRGNRQWHREFIAAMPFATQTEHLRRAKKLLEDTFGVLVTTFVPPGNALTERLALTALDLGFELVTCRYDGVSPAITDDRQQVVLHDRDLVTDWARLTDLSPRAPFTTVREWAPSRAMVPAP